MRAHALLRSSAVFSVLGCLAACGVPAASDGGADARETGDARSDASGGEVSTPVDAPVTADASEPDEGEGDAALGMPADALEPDGAELDATAPIDASQPDVRPDAPAPIDVARPDASRSDATPVMDARTDAPVTDARPDATPVMDARADATPTDARPDTGTPVEGGLMSMGPSAGCGRAAGIALNSWVVRSLTVGGASRDYYVRLPTGYDPARRYPIVYQFHGCSDSPARQDNNVPVQNQSGTEAIHVRGRAAASCWNTSATGADVPYIDAMMAAVEGNFCVDTGRRFASGYSSGSFMTHVLGCIRGAQFRGIASIAGGQTGSRCTGNPAALLIHDLNDGTVNISASVGARDQLATRNGCDAMAARVPTSRTPCEAYQGCDAGQPVVWCQTSMRNHDRQDALAAPAFWEFFNMLPAR